MGRKRALNTFPYQTAYLRSRICDIYGTSRKSYFVITSDMLYSLLNFSPSINRGDSISSNRFVTNSKSYRILLRDGSNSCIGGIMNTNGNLRLHRLNMLNLNIGVFNGNFLYAGRNRTFTSRSAVTLVDKGISVSKELSLIPSVCEVPQVAHFKKAIKEELINLPTMLDILLH